MRMVLVTLVAATITHLVPVEVVSVMGEVLRIGVFSAGWIRPVIAVVRIKMVIYVAVEIVMTVVPRSGPDENAVNKPFGPVVSPWRALIRSEIVIAIGADRLGSNID